MNILTARIYDAPAGVGYRVLADRLWPRGISKAAARIDYWAKDLAPSHALRAWFGHDPARWEAFVEKYRAEIQSDEGPLTRFKEQVSDRKRIVLLFAAKDEVHNNATALKRILQEMRIGLASG